MDANEQWHAQRITYDRVSVCTRISLNRLKLISSDASATDMFVRLNGARRVYHWSLRALHVSYSSAIVFAFFVIDEAIAVLQLPM